MPRFHRLESVTWLDPLDWMHEVWRRPHRRIHLKTPHQPDPPDVPRHLFDDRGRIYLCGVVLDDEEILLELGLDLRNAGEPLQGSLDLVWSPQSRDSELLDHPLDFDVGGLEARRLGSRLDGNTGSVAGLADR